jgi:hypothetical protein
MSSSCNVGRDKLITATMPMCYTLAFFPNSVNPQFQLDFSTTYHDLLPIPHHNPVIHSKPTFIVVPNDDQLMLFYVHLLLPHAHIP